MSVIGAERFRGNGKDGCARGRTWCCFGLVVASAPGCRTLVPWLPVTLGVVVQVVVLGRCAPHHTHLLDPNAPDRAVVVERTLFGPPDIHRE